MPLVDTKKADTPDHFIEIVGSETTPIFYRAWCKCRHWRTSGEDTSLDAVASAAEAHIAEVDSGRWVDPAATDAGD